MSTDDLFVQPEVSKPVVILPLTVVLFEYASPAERPEAKVFPEVLMSNVRSEESISGVR